MWGGGCRKQANTHSLGRVALLPLFLLQLLPLLLPLRYAIRHLSQHDTILQYSYRNHNKRLRTISTVVVEDLT